MTGIRNQREGFWYSEYEEDLPMPVVNDSPWEGQEEFLKALIFLENRLMKEYQRRVDIANAGGKWESYGYVNSYRGVSVCRICHISNGSREFSCKGFIWPEGFRHYIKKHNVKPSSNFISSIGSGLVRIDNI